MQIGTPRLLKALPSILRGYGIMAQRPRGPEAKVEQHWEVMLGGLSPPLQLQGTLKAPPFLQHWYRVCLELGAKMKAHCGWSGLWSQLAAHAGGEESTLELSEAWPSGKLVPGKYIKHHCLGASSRHPFLQAPVPTALCEASRCILGTVFLGR